MAATGISQENSNPSQCKYVDEPAAAKHLGISYSGLRALRKAGTGPRFRRFGKRVKYALADCDMWADQQIAEH